MEFLKKLFGTTADGQAEALTYEQLAQKMTEAKLNVADLSTGEYVAKAKYDAKVEELKGISAQLGEANKAIEGFKAMDLEGIQKSADEWKQKYEQETANLKSQMEQKELSFAAERFFSGYKFTSDVAAAGVRAEFDKQGFKLGEDGTFQGAKEWITGIQEKNPTAFEPKETPSPPPAFTAGMSGSGAPAKGDGNPFGFNFTGVRPKPKD